MLKDEQVRLFDEPMLWQNVPVIYNQFVNLLFDCLHFVRQVVILVLKQNQREVQVLIGAENELGELKFRQGLREVEGGNWGWFWGRSYSQVDTEKQKES